MTVSSDARAVTVISLSCAKHDMVIASTADNAPNIRSPDPLALRHKPQSGTPRWHGRLHRSQRQIIVLLHRHLDMLVLQHRQRPGDAPPRRVRHDDVVDAAALGGG